MAAGAEVLKEFLVAVGYDVDEKGMKSAVLKVSAFAAGIQALAGGIWYGLMRVADAQSSLLSTAEAAGTTVARLEELRYVATQTGAAAEAMDTSLKGLGAAMAGATIGQGGLATFQHLGVRIKDANGQLRDTVDVLFEVGEKIKGMDGARQQMFLSQLGIDRSLVRALTDDVSGLREAYRQMYAAAGTDAEEAAQASREFMNEVGTMRTLFGMLAKAVSLQFIGKMKDDLVRLRKMVIENFAKISHIFATVVHMVLRVAGAVGAMTTRLMQWFGGIVDWFGRLDEGTQDLILVILGLAAAWKFLNLSFMATPLGMVLALSAALVALIDDYQTWRERGESLIDWSAWAPGIEAALSALGNLRYTLLLVLGVFAAWVAIPKIIAGVSLALKGLAVAMKLLAAGNPLLLVAMGLATAAGLVIDNWETVKGWFDDFIGWLGDKFSWVTTAAGAVAGLFGKGERPPLAPPPAGPPALGAGESTANLQATTNIYVDGSGDPAAVGRSVAGQQNRVNADLVRNTKGAMR